MCFLIVLSVPSRWYYDFPLFIYFNLSDFDLLMLIKWCFEISRVIQCVLHQWVTGSRIHTVKGFQKIKSEEASAELCGDKYR